MRALVAYLFALAAIATGVWFGYFARGDAAGHVSAHHSSKSPVILAPVVVAPFADTMNALGTAIANESVDLIANRTDLVTAVHFTDGQKVDKGAVLVELQTAEEQARLAEAKALLEDREAAYQRAVELHAKGISSESEVTAALAQMNAAKSRVLTLEETIKDHVITAPFAGVLGLRRVSVGALVQPATVIATLDDLSFVKVDFTIPETWLSAVRVGQAVLVRSDAWPDTSFRGEVVAIDTRLDPRTRSVTIRARVANPDMKLRPGMLMKVEVDRGEQPSRQVPEEALVQKGDTHYVFVVGEDSVAHRVDVEIGRRLVGRVEVLGGVEEGQKVVVEGLVRMRDGAAVEVVGVRDGAAK